MHSHEPSQALRTCFVALFIHGISRTLAVPISDKSLFMNYLKCLDSFVFFFLFFLSFAGSSSIEWSI